MTRCVAKLGRSVIVYDDAIISQIKEDLFEPSNWPDADIVPGYSGGRGTTLFINHEGDDWVLRHYHRGGAVGKFLTDQFLWLGPDQSRPCIEWDLLAELHNLQLPAPVPVAARYVRHGLCYTADLITRRLPDVVPLSRRMEAAPLTKDIWRAVGHCVGLFHRSNIYHADLNAHNLQISGDNHLWLLDFDRGRIMRGGGKWQQDNLDRLQRSFRKISQNGSVTFSDQEWRWLIQGYESN
jgi:3-deoxy-D-manno-octulosonic acid kinase